MALKDNREFIAVLEANQELQRIDREVDWNLEAGAIMRKCNEEGAPAPFFQKLKDYPEGYRLLGSPLASFRRFAIAMELKPDAHYLEILNTYDQRIKNSIKPTLVSDGPCKENILLEDEVDVLKFPVPLIHDGDGGRYIGTWHITATKDIDSDWVNWGMYRIMVHDKKTIAVLATTTQHIGLILSKYKEKNIPMEIAIAIAPEPITTLVSTCSIPAGVSEVDIIGGFRSAPLEVVKCETIDLVVPATSEIVIEGEILPGNMKDEGPFGEYTGYSAGGVHKMPVIDVKAVTYRNDPILTASCMGCPIDDADVCIAISWASGIRSDLVRAGFPITGFYIPPESSGCICVVSVKNIYSNIANQIAACIWANKNGKFIPRIIVVEDDIDPTDMKQVIFAWATKCHPKNGTMVLENMPGTNLIPFLSKNERKFLKCSNVVYDCMWPLDWEPENIPRLASFNSIYPENIQKRVLSNWKNYGYKQ